MLELIFGKIPGFYAVRLSVLRFLAKKGSTGCTFCEFLSNMPVENEKYKCYVNGFLITGEETKVMCCRLR